MRHHPIMHIKMLVFLLPFLLVSGACNIGNAENQNAGSDKTTHVKTLFLNYADAKSRNLISNPCDTFSIEFEGLYQPTDTLPNGAEETLILDNFLKERGYTQVDYGRGNWDRGPRIVSLELVKENCRCHVYKKYYYLDKTNANKFSLKITEKIVCNVDNNAVE